MDRTIRISEEIKREISDIIRTELKDPRINNMVSITNVKVTKDLRYAKVHVSIYGKKEEQEGTFLAIKNAAGFIRREVGKRIKIRYIPEMLFELDSSIEEGFYITGLIDKIKKENEKE